MNHLNYHHTGPTVTSNFKNSLAQSAWDSGSGLDTKMYSIKATFI